MYNETVIVFGDNNQLNGILTAPDIYKSDAAVLLLNSGSLHRVGPQRLYVNIARDLGLAGFLSLRFDFSGLGESFAIETNLPFKEQLKHEISWAMSYISSHKNIHKFIIIGICSGAETAFHFALNNPSIVGCIPINGIYLEGDEYVSVIDNALERTKVRYYKKNALNLSRWIKLLTGKSKVLSNRKLLVSKFKHLLTNQTSKVIEQKSEPQILNRHRQAYNSKTKLFYIICEGSVAFDLFELLLKDWFKKENTSDHFKIKILADTDHLFTLSYSQSILRHEILDWMALYFYHDSE